ncbi:MAG: SDR family NAD(P)-dependent oxidoreductase [Desulfobacterota bacterium]|jgi:NAD(P)-dependent dehydrogenase (short-subunit alcohol dehydrogenase family)|nr:SDR family NAD(P)-dependent oxidoreductase [Thermodesulfobacteriota bacterium]
MPAWARIFDVDSRILRTTLEINTLGALRMCQAFVPLIMEAGCGRVVNVSSSLGQLNGMTDEKMVPAYPLSNTALNAVTLMVADAAPPPQPPWVSVRAASPTRARFPARARKQSIRS